MTGQRHDDATDARWCEHQDALAVGESPSSDVPAGADDRWVLEEDFYRALRQEAQEGSDLGEPDLEIIERALAADAEIGGTAAASTRWWLAPIAAAAALLLVWLVWPGSPSLRVESGSWIAQVDGTRHDDGGSLPLAMWLVAGQDACGSVAEATVCADAGTVVRISVPKTGNPRIEVERGRVTVRSGTWTVVTPSAEEALHSGESVAVGGSTVAVTEDAGPPAIVPPPPATAAPEPTPPTPPTEVAEVETPQKTKRAVEDAATMLSKARRLRGAGDTKGAASAYAELIKHHGGTAEANAARISLGQLRLSAGRAKAALSQFNRYLKRGGPLAEEALWGKIQALDSLNRTSALRDAVAELQRRFPRSAYRSRAQERLEP
ncbi:MAG: tetratricopeptide repeat protein [Myxococcota bacterium]